MASVEVVRVRVVMEVATWVAVGQVEVALAAEDRAVAG